MSRPSGADTWPNLPPKMRRGQHHDSQGNDDRREGENRSTSPRSSRMDADGRLSRAPLSRVEGGNGVVDGCDGTNVRPQSSIPHALDDLTQLGAIGLDDEVDGHAVDGPCLGWSDNGHQRSSGSDQTSG